MKEHRYRVTLEYLAAPDGQPSSKEPLVFEAGNHDDIFRIVELMHSRALLDASTSTAFIVGLKLFGEVILKNRNDPLFADFWPHFHAFMKHFKGMAQNAPAKDATQPLPPPGAD